jgi:glucan biosynthesis protein C
VNTVPTPKSSAGAPVKGARRQGRHVAIDYLRACLIVLVVLLHAALAYTTFSTYDEKNWVDSSAPVVDTVRWPLLDSLVMSYDTFFMPLLFLVSGLFTLSSLKRKGDRGFLLARLRRLGLPFVFGALVIAPLAFLPSYLMADPRPPAPYLATFFTSDGWPVGPPWFLWVLLVFNAVVVLVHRFAPNVLAGLRRQPTALVILLVSIASFLPLSLVGSHYWWISLGPFDAQPIRLGLYFAYFVLGMALGTGQRWREVGWPKYWAAWFVFGLISFVVYMMVQGETFPLPGLASRAMLGVTFAASCAGASLGLLGAFRRFVRKPYPILDSLSANAFGIYLVHYAAVLWIQFALLSVPWPAWAKFGVVFAGGLALSWGASALARKIPAVGRSKPLSPRPISRRPESR